MSLEEEMELYQFAQGVYPAAELLERYNQRNEHEQALLFFNLHHLLLRLVPTDADIDQLVADDSPGETDLVADVLKAFRSKTGLIRSICNGHERASLVLLKLFKIVYQRRFLAEKENPVNWQYRDLADPEVVASVLAEHRALVEEVYAHPSFRGEFASMAKLWNAYVGQRNYQAPPPGNENRFDFVTYDEITNTSVLALNTKRMWDIRFLERALTNAFSIHYGLNTEQAERLVYDVMERHLRKTFRIDRFGHPITPAD